MATLKQQRLIDETTYGFDEATKRAVERCGKSQMPSRLRNSCL